MAKHFMTKVEAGTSRRAVLAGGVAALGTASLGSVAALAQRRPAGPATVAAEDLMKPVGLPDLVIGKADAPVTIVEYASMSCGHCAHFHTNELPKLKAAYLDTGKARLIFRDFPLNRLAQAASLLARCGGGDKTYPLIGVFFEKIDTWLVRNPLPELFKIARQAGFTKEAFEKCLADQPMLDKLLAGRDHASGKLGVNSTPTFFINGKRHSGAPTFEELEKAIKAATPS